MNIHPNARTTPKIRAEIRASGLSRKQVMEKYNVGYATAAKWLKRDDFEDRTHQPHKLQTRLTELQEFITDTRQRFGSRYLFKIKVSQLTHAG
jgi:transposase